MVHEVGDSEFAFVRLGFVSDLSCLLFDLQKAILEHFGMPFNDMEQEELNLPFNRADLVRSNAVLALQILNYEIGVPGSNIASTHAQMHRYTHTHIHTHTHTRTHTLTHSHTHTNTHTLLLVHVGSQTILRRQHQAYNFFHHANRLVSYTMFSIDNRPMGVNRDSLKETMEEAEVHAALNALNKIIQLMDVQLNMAGLSNQVMCVTIISELTC